MASSPSISRNSSSELVGRVALVTGAAVRLGRTISLALACAGCSMVLHYHRSRRDAETLAREIQSAGGRAVLLRADLRSKKATEKLARDAERAFGGVDILINSAAVFWPTPRAKLAGGDLDAFLELNLKSPYHLSVLIGERMYRRKRGCIINLACVSALKPWKNFVPYSISKAGVSAMTVGLAKAFAPHVRVNAIAPGAVLPPERTSAAERKALAARVPLQRLGSADDIARAVVYLATADYVTGQVHCVDGGRSVV